MRQNPDWLSVRQAATTCDTTTRTVQGWIASGKVQSRLSQDGRREVWRESLPSRSDTSSDTRSDTTGERQEYDKTGDTPTILVGATGSDPALAAVLGALVQQVKDLAGLVERQDATIREMRALPAPQEPAGPDPALAALQEQIAALCALSEQQAAELAAVRAALALSPPAPVEATPQPAPARPWWVFWRRAPEPTREKPTPAPGVPETGGPKRKFRG